MKSTKRKSKARRIAHEGATEFDAHRGATEKSHRARVLLERRLSWRSVAMAKKSYKMENPFEKREAEAARIRKQYPERRPVIVERAKKSDVPEIAKKKYLVPADITVGQFVYVIRKRINLDPEKAIFVFVKNILPPNAALMSTVYEKNKDEDGFLYITYSGESTFGTF